VSAGAPPTATREVHIEKDGLQDRNKHIEKMMQDQNATLDRFVLLESLVTVSHVELQLALWGKDKKKRNSLRYVEWALLKRREG